MVARHYGFEWTAGLFTGMTMMHTAAFAFASLAIASRAPLSVTPGYVPPTEREVRARIVFITIMLGMAIFVDQMGYPHSSDCIAFLLIWGYLSSVPCVEPIDVPNPPEVPKVEPIEVEPIEVPVEPPRRMRSRTPRRTAARSG